MPVIFSLRRGGRRAGPNDGASTMRWTSLLGLSASLFSAICYAEAKELVVYTSRKSHLVKPVFEAFEKETGIHISLITDKAPALIQRLKVEGARTKADLLITVDAGNLWSAQQEGVLAPLKSQLLEKKIPAHLMDPEGHWFGMSLRARTLVYHKARVSASDLKGYKDLADPKWKGRLCLRTAKKVYNQSLVAMLLKQYGEAATESIVQGWVANLAAPVFSNDTSLIKAIAKGECDVGIVNTYYLGRLIQEDPELPVGLFWQGKEQGGVHINISGVAVVKHAKHPGASRRFVEWLVTDKAQKIFADANLEFPAVSGIEPHAICKSWGPFVASDVELVEAGAGQSRAVMLMDRAGYR